MTNFAEKSCGDIMEYAWALTAWNYVANVTIKPNALHIAQRLIFYQLSGCTCRFLPIVDKNMKLEGSVAVITGGARGIGKAITKALLQNKGKVEFFTFGL